MQYPQSPAQAEQRRQAGKSSAAKRPREVQIEQARRMRRALAVKEIAEHWHELTDDQRRALSEVMARGGPQ